MPLGMEVSLGPGRLCVRRGPRSPLPRRVKAPNFQPISILAKRLDASRCHLVWTRGGAQPRRLCVKWGTSTPSPNRERSPKFSTHVYYGQTAGWIKMPLGTEVGLGPGDIVLDRDPAPSPAKRAQLPEFSAHVYCGQMAVCIRYGNGDRPRPTRHCV